MTFLSGNGMHSAKVSSDEILTLNSALSHSSSQCYLSAWPAFHVLRPAAPMEYQNGRRYSLARGASLIHALVQPYTNRYTSGRSAAGGFPA